MRATAPRLLDIEDALIDGMTLVEGGVTFREAACEIYGHGLTPDAMTTFAIRGIAAFLSDREANRGRSWAESVEVPENGLGVGQPAARGRLSVVPKHYAKERWERVLASNTWDVGDARKALLHFTLDDAIAVMNTARARASGYQRVAEAMALTRDLLTKHKAETVASLPVKAKQAIAEAVA